MSIIIFGDSFTFPDGNAATNRVHTYAKGFYENGISVHVICFASQYSNSGNGITNGIHYYHPFGQSKRSIYFLLRQQQKILKYFYALKLIREINKIDGVSAIICYTHILQTQLYAFVIAIIINTKLILERSEHPLRRYQDSFCLRIQGRAKVYVETKLYDGFFCISNYLIDFYKSRGVSNKKLFLVPSTVDTERFQIPIVSQFPFEYILYSGSLTVKKDGVDILIKSFAKICGKYSEINLVLIGKGDNLDDEIIIENLVRKLKIEHRVYFTGQIPRSEIPKYLSNAKILALARPQSLVSDAGFPSKLTEYLATGKPVVVTKVGEISLYLRDNENAFLTNPDSIDEFADKLDFVLSNYKLATQVGEKGKELTSAIFNYAFQVTRMIDFIIKIDG